MHLILNVWQIIDYILLRGNCCRGNKNFSTYFALPNRSTTNNKQLKFIKDNYNYSEK